MNERVVKDYASEPDLYRGSNRENGVYTLTRILPDASLSLLAQWSHYWLYAKRSLQIQLTSQERRLDH